jgi:hypothetical protein
VIPTAEAIEERFKVPCISVTGSDVALGEWCFAFPMGSHTDEPIFWADLRAKMVPAASGAPARGCHSATGPDAAGWARAIWWPAG